MSTPNSSSGWTSTVDLVADWFVHGRVAAAREADSNWDNDVESLLSQHIARCENGCSLDQLRHGVRDMLVKTGFRPDFVGSWLDERIEGAWARYRKDHPDG